MHKRFLAALILVAGCASASASKIPGRYAVILDPRMSEQVRQAIPSIADSILRGLEDRFESVTPVTAMNPRGYDGVIAIQYGGGNLFTYGSSTQTVSRFTIVEYEIRREGREPVRGNTRIGGLIRGENYTGQTSTVKEALAIGIEVARVIAKELTQPAAQTP
jgi:hypothetical protein